MRRFRQRWALNIPLCGRACEPVFIRLRLHHALSGDSRWGIAARFLVRNPLFASLRIVRLPRNPRDVGPGRQRNLSRHGLSSRAICATVRRIRGLRRGVWICSDRGTQEIFKSVGARSRRTQGGHEGPQADVECGCRRARTPLNRRGGRSQTRAAGLASSAGLQ